jgi:HK97 family phage portal protein
VKWLERIVAGAEFRASGLANPAGWLVDSFGTTMASSGEKVTRRNAMGLAAVFSAVEKISESVGGLPLKVYRVVEDDDRVEARAHRSYRMLHDKPNSQTTAHAFWSTVTAQLLLDGNSLLWKERDPFTGEVESLYLLNGADWTIEWDGQRKLFKQDNTGRRCTDEQILHIIGFSLDGLIGCSRITYCREALGTALGRARYEGEFYAQGATFPGVIEYPGRLGEQGTKNLANAMAGKHHGPGQRHKTPVLEEGATFKPVGMSLQDMQFVEGAQLSRSDIATMFNLPAAYLNASSGDSLTYATTESNQIQFAQQAVAPLTNRIAKALSHDPGILPQTVMYAEFVLEGLLRADMKTRAEYWALMKATLGLDPEFIASRENIPQSALVEPEPVPAPLVEEIEEAEVTPLQIAPRASSQ